MEGFSHPLNQLISDNVSISNWQFIMVRIYHTPTILKPNEVSATTEALRGSGASCIFPALFVKDGTNIKMIKFCKKAGDKKRQKLNLFQKNCDGCKFLERAFLPTNQKCDGCKTFAFLSGLVALSLSFFLSVPAV